MPQFEYIFQLHITHYMLNCDKSCVIVCVPSIFFILLLDRNGFSLLCEFELELSYIYGV